MQRMLDVASTFASEVGLEFSTDPTPTKSKSKSIYAVGRSVELQKTEPLRLSCQKLPWVPPATHLGHESQIDGTMNMDTKMHRGSFINHCLEVQDTFLLAAPDGTFLCLMAEWHPL